jgi:hypothetical protein
LKITYAKRNVYNLKTLKHTGCEWQERLIGEFMEQNSPSRALAATVAGSTDEVRALRDANGKSD